MRSSTEVEDLIIELLAANAGRDPADLRAELANAGAELPVDSLLAVEVLNRVQEVCAVRLSANEETARAMRSIRAYALVVWNLIEESRKMKASA